MTDVSIDRGGAAATATRRIGRYEVLHQIGRGGMAVVYLARQPAPERYVALKELGNFDATEPQAAQRFVREAQFAGSLNHPNIVTVHEYFEDGGIPYIAMEYAQRGSLRPYVGSLSLPQIAGVLEGILAGLTHAEQAGIVHRDLKPENLMVTDEGRVKITDFGIAKATLKAGMSTFLTKEGMTVGTPIYMAPEQAVAADKIGPWTDLYSVGVMAYEHVVGRAPFRDEPTPVILFRHVNDRIPPACEVSPTVDPALSAWIDRLLVKSPAERTQTAAEAWDSLEDIIIDLLGPRWRREARLGENTVGGAGGKPLTPAPFESTRTPTPPPDGVGPTSKDPTTAEPPAPPPPDAAAGSTDVRAAIDTATPAVEPEAEVIALLSEEPAVAQVDPAAATTRAAARSGPTTSQTPLTQTSGAAVETVVPDTRPAQLERPSRAHAVTRQGQRDVPAQAEGAAVSPAASPARIARRRVIATAAGIGVLAIAAVLFAVLSSGSRKVAQVVQSSARSGPITIRYAAPWRATALPSAAAGVLARQPAPIQLASNGARLDAGSLVTSATIPGDVPPSLRSRYGRPSAALGATINGDPAREYRWTASGIDAFIIPTVSGDLAAICTTTSAVAARSCTSLAMAATLTGVQPLAPGPDSSLAAALTRSVAPADTARGNLKGLRAGKLSDRTRAAQAISIADAAAATSLARLSVPARYQPRVARLSSDMRAESAALGGLAAAAQHNDRKAYVGAAKNVASASQKVAVAASALRADGLTIPALAALSVPGLPPAPKRPTPAPPPSSGSSSSSGSSTVSGSGVSSSQSYTPSGSSAASQSYQTAPPSSQSSSQASSPTRGNGGTHSSGSQTAGSGGSAQVPAP